MHKDQGIVPWSYAAFYHNDYLNEYSQGGKKMTTDTIPKQILLSFPCERAEREGLSYEYLQKYFTRIPGGISSLILLAVNSAVHEDAVLAPLIDKACSEYDRIAQELLDKGWISQKDYAERYREFRKNLLQLARYVSLTIAPMFQHRVLYQVTFFNIEPDESKITMRLSLPL